MTISRRALLTFLPGLALAESLSRPETHFPTNGRDRLAVTSWPFRDYISSPDNRSKVPVAGRMDLKQFPAFVARRFGVYNINPLVAHFSSTDDHYLAAFGNTLASHDKDYNARGVSAMLNHAWNMCHVKDSVQSEDGRIQHVDLKSMFALARQSGYRGYYSMEFDTRAGDPIPGTQNLVQQTLHFLS